MARHGRRRMIDESWWLHEAIISAGEVERFIFGMMDIDFSVMSPEALTFSYVNDPGRHTDAAIAESQNTRRSYDCYKLRN